MSHIHFKSVYNINYDKVTFDSTSLTLRELKNLIAEKSKLSKKLDFDLEISNAQSNQVYQENDVILKNTRVIVKRVIKSSTTPLRQKSPKPSPSLPASQSGLNLPNLASDRLSAKSKSVSPSTSSTNLKESTNVSSLDKSIYDSLAPLGIPAKPLVYIEGSDKQTPEGDVRMDEKAKLESILASSMTKSPISETRMQGFTKSWQKQTSPINRPIPPGYVCVICRKPGHLKQFCPEAANLPKPEDRPKYPSGIPRTNLRPAQPGEKFAMLGPEGYVVTEIDKEAAKVVKKDRFLFEDEEINSEKIEIETKIEEIPKELKCPFGDHLLKDAVLVPCCGHFICCDECIRQKIISEETIICPNKECDQEIGPMVSITPDHETRKKVQDYLSKLKRKKLVTQTETKTDVFFDMILSEVNGKEEDLEKSEPISPLQDSNISSSELLSQQLIAASAEYQQMSPVPLPSPPTTPTVDLSQVRAQSHAYSNHQYRARFLGQKSYSGQPYPHGTQGFYPHMPRGSFYGQLRPRFMRPAVNMYPQMPFYPTIEPVAGNYQNVMSESQFYEYQESLKKEKEHESRVDKKEEKHRRSRSRERFKRSRSRSRSRRRSSYKPRHRSKSRSRTRHRSGSRSRRKYRRSKSKHSERKYKKKSPSRSSSRKRKHGRSKSKERKKNKTRSRSISLPNESNKRHKSSKKKEK